MLTALSLCILICVVHCGQSEQYDSSTQHKYENFIICNSQAHNDYERLFIRL